jgi:hypothetical protein
MSHVIACVAFLTHVTASNLSPLRHQRLEPLVQDAFSRDPLVLMLTGNSGRGLAGLS